MTTGQKRLELTSDDCHEFCLFVGVAGRISRRGCAAVAPSRGKREPSVVGHNLLSQRLLLTE